MDSGTPAVSFPGLAVEVNATNALVPQSESVRVVPAGDVSS